VRGEGAVGGFCGLGKGSGDDKGGGAVARGQSRAEIRGERKAFVSFSELPKVGEGGGGEVVVAFYGKLP